MRKWCRPDVRLVIHPAEIGIYNRPSLAYTERLVELSGDAPYSGSRPRRRCDAGSAGPACYVMSSETQTPIAVLPRYLLLAYVALAFPAFVALSWKECLGLGVAILLLAFLMDESVAATAASAATVAAGAAALAGGTDGLNALWFRVLVHVARVGMAGAQLGILAVLIFRLHPRRGARLTAGATCVAIGLFIVAATVVLGEWSALGVAYAAGSAGLFLVATSAWSAMIPRRRMLLALMVVPLLMGAGKLGAGRIVAARDPKGGWDDLVAHYQRAVWLDPTGLAPRRELAYSFAAGGKVATALEVLQTAVGLNGLEVPSRRMRAVSEAEVGLWSHAVFAFLQNDRLAGQDWEELGALLTGEVDTHRSASRAHLNMAWYLRLSGREEEATEVLREALLAGPNLRGLHYNLGLLLEDMRLKSLASMEYEAEAILFPDSPDAWLKRSDRSVESQGDTLLEAESMEATVGKPAEDGWGLYGEGELRGGFFLNAGGWRAIGVVAQGSRAEEMWPIMTVWLDGTEAGRWVVCGRSWIAYWLVGAFAPGAHTIRVRFENDCSSPDGSEDRNLWVDRVITVLPTGAEPREDLLGRLGLERVRIFGGTDALAG